jgi:hypothetical protein
MVRGGPVFLLDVDTQKTNRLGFFTTRWVRAATEEDASAAACKLVTSELAATGTKNPPNMPVETVIEEVVELSWAESVRHPGAGRGFTFFIDDAS